MSPATAKRLAIGGAALFCASSLLAIVSIFGKGGPPWFCAGSGMSLVGVGLMIASWRPRRRGGIRTGTLMVVLGVLGVTTLVPLAVIALLVLTYDPVDNPFATPDFIARSIYRARHRIATYYAAHGALPQDIRGLLAGDGVTEEALDHFALWPYAIEVAADGVTVNITCLGRDNSPGGEGMDRDINGKFRADLTPGAEVKQVGPWIEDPVDDVKPWGFP